MSFKSFWHWLGSMIVSAIAAWWAHHDPGAAVPAVFAAGCASHFIGHAGGKADNGPPA